MSRNRVTMKQLRYAIVSNKYLPDHPEPFRRQMAVNALAKVGIEVPPTTLDGTLLTLLTQGYLVRSEEMERVATMSPFHLWMFARSDRTSDRPGYQTGDPRDVWGNK